MTFAGRHIHLTFGGELGSSETWTCGLRLWDPSFAPLAGVPADRDALKTACENAISDVASIVNALIADNRTGISAAASVSWCKLNPVDEQGLQFDTIQTIEHRWSQPSTGGRTMAPFQTALCATLRTAIPRGRGHAGRIFLPVGSMPLDMAGKIATVMAQDVANSVAERIYALNDVASWGVGMSPQVSVMSKRSGKNTETGPGPVHAVTGVDVGQVLDTQRRRRRSIPETPQHGTLVGLH